MIISNEFDDNNSSIDYLAVLYKLNSNLSDIEEKAPENGTLNINFTTISIRSKFHLEINYLNLE